MNKLQELRKNAGLRQIDLAEEAGLSVRILQKYETGERSINNAKAASVYRIAKVLGCTVEDLIEAETEDDE